MLKEFDVFLYSHQILLLTKACEDLELEKQEREDEKVRYLGEKMQPLQLSGLSNDDLMVKDVKGSHNLSRQNLPK